MDKSLSKIVTNAFEVRNEADYDVTYIISKDEVMEQIARAAFFIETVERYLETRGVEIPGK